MNDRFFSLLKAKQGEPAPVCVIAELSANHNGSLNRAKDLIRAALEAGADAVKLQTYTPDTMTIPCNNDYFKIHGGLWDGYTLYDLYQEAQTPREWHWTLKKCADDLGIPLFSTPFDETSVDFLEQLNVPAYKIASFELVDHQLLRKVASTGKPVIMSTGMATLAEIDEAMSVLRTNGADNVILLLCTSDYPASPRDANLRRLPHLAKTFTCLAGVSDHTMTSAVPVAAVALGAKVIEKHFTLSRADGGPDSGFSMEKGEFETMVHDIRIAEEALGKVDYCSLFLDRTTRRSRRSLFVVQDIAAGDHFTRDNVRSIRPGHGLMPREIDHVLGRKARNNIALGTPLSWDMIE
ncbi:MAG: pseudaminic acid synthase [Thermodesulfobacteriota bacterium]|nr:pseudaminic acid synthase [Thermodesulfobacteriota bacterium]